MDKKYLIWTNVITLLLLIIMGLSFYFVTNDKEEIEYQYIEGIVTEVGNYQFFMNVGNADYKVTVNDTNSLSVGDKIKVKTTKEQIDSNTSVIAGLEFEVIKKASNEIVNSSDSNKKPVQNDDKEDNNTVEENNKKEDNDFSNNEIVYTENDVIKYFKQADESIDNSKTFSEKLKSTFIKIVDFFFYDGEIYGYKFSELTDKTKIKVMELAFKIDSKIMTKFPNYKETISSKYHDFKAEMVGLYMEAGSLICENNPELCSTVKESFSNIKSYASIGWDYIKNLTNTGIDKLQTWYEIYSGK